MGQEGYQVELSAQVHAFSRVCQGLVWNAERLQDTVWGHCNLSFFSLNFIVHKLNSNIIFYVVDIVKSDSRAQLSIPQLCLLIAS